MKLRLPPAVVGLAFLFAIAAAPAIWPEGTWDWPRPIRGALAILLLAASTALAVTAAVQCVRRETTVDPLRPERSSTLLTGGAYRVSRNPMYVGFAMTLLAAAVWLAHPVGLVLVLLFTWVLDRYQIRFEEEALLRRFGEDYDEYRQRVRRWL